MVIAPALKTIDLDAVLQLDSVSESSLSVNVGVSNITTSGIKVVCTNDPSFIITHND